MFSFNWKHKGGRTLDVDGQGGGGSWKLDKFHGRLMCIILYICNTSTKIFIKKLKISSLPIVPCFKDDKSVSFKGYSRQQDRLGQLSDNIFIFPEVMFA